jgi:Flp pilus assembly protein TadG
MDAALVFPILLSLTFGTIEFGYYFFVKHSLQGAAREGCRVAITPSGDNTQVNTAIASSLRAAGLQTSATTVDTTKFTVTTSPSSVSGATAGTTVTVTITATWGTVGSGFRPLAIIGSSKQVVGSTTMRKEG